MSGKNPLPTRDGQAYEGANVLVPIGGWQVVRSVRDPTTNDKKYPIGTLWINTALKNIWFLTQAPGVWTQLIQSGATLVPVANGGTGRATLTTNGVLIGEGTSAINQTTAGTDGQVLTGNTGADPSFQAIGTKSGLTAHGVLTAEGASAFNASTAGTSGQVFTSGGASADGAYQNIGVNSGLTNHGVLLAQNNSAFVATATGAAGTVLAGNGVSSDPTFQPIPSLNVVDNTTGTVASPTTILVNTTYIADQASVTTGFLLPATAALGNQITIAGNGPGGWQIQQNAGQSIKMNSSTTTTGTGGSLSSTNRYNAVTLVCVVAGASTTWAVNDFSGSFTFV